MVAKKQEINLTKSLSELNAIVSWFDTQENVDVEQGLEKVRAAATLIKESKTRLAQIENEFKEIEKSFSSAVFEFNADKSFKLTTRSNSKLFSMVKDMTANSKWRLNKDKTIAIGNQSNKYSIMNIIVIAANDKIIFKMSETELNLEVQKE